jgi:hypothetical protein
LRGAIILSWQFGGKISLLSTPAASLLFNLAHNAWAHVCTKHAPLAEKKKTLLGFACLRLFGNDKFNKKKKMYFEKYFLGSNRSPKYGFTSDFTARNLSLSLPPPPPPSPSLSLSLPLSVSRTPSQSSIPHPASITALWFGVKPFLFVLFY